MIQAILHKSNFGNFDMSIDVLKGFTYSSQILQNFEILQNRDFATSLERNLVAKMQISRSNRA